jgi:predicted nucleic acid-binding protein
MNGPEFADSNIFVYAYDPSDPRKQQIAREVLLRGSRGHGIIASSQVFSEFASVLLHRMNPPASPPEVSATLQSLSDIRMIGIDRSLILRAVEAHERYRVHFWDGMIVAAAERGGCSRMWSEDLNPGQSYFGVKVENPFR